MKKFKRVRILTATSSFQVEWSNWGSYGKLLISLLNEQNPATFILHSTSHFLFHYVTNCTVLCYKSVTLNNNDKKKWGWTVIYNATKNSIKLEEDRCSPNAYTFYKNNIKEPDYYWRHTVLVPWKIVLSENRVHRVDVVYSAR